MHTASVVKHCSTHTYAAMQVCLSLGVCAGQCRADHIGDDVTGLLQVKLQGIPGIRKVFMRELKTTHLDQDGMFQTENQWVLDTEGVNLLDVSSLPRWPLLQMVIAICRFDSVATYLKPVVITANLLTH